MKKIAILFAVLLVTISAVAQEAKPTKEKAKKETCCAKKDSKSKATSTAEVEKCKIKCKTSEKKC